MQQNNSNIARQIEDEHAALRTLTESVSVSFARPPDGEFSEWKLSLVFKLRDFRNALVKHFDFEEDGGFMADVVVTAPHEKRKVDQLESEHAEFLTMVDSITSYLKKMSDPAAFQGARDQLEDLVGRLHDHESLESDLIGTVYFHDFGVGD